MRREVVEQVAASKPRVYDPAAGKSIADVFRTDTMDRGHESPDFRGEDMAFFADVIDLGFEVWLDPRLKLGHVGTREYRADPMAALRLEGAMDEAVADASA